MAFSIDQFRYNLSGDGARPNLFEITLDISPFTSKPQDVPVAGGAGGLLSAVTGAVGAVTSLATSVTAALSNPIGALTGLVNGASSTSLLVRASELPGSAINMADLYYFGRQAKFAGNRVFQDWSVTVINDENFAIRAAIENWMDYINTPINNIRSSAYPNISTYGKDANVIQYGKTGNVLYQYNFVGIWPTEISPIGLDWGSNDQIEEFNVNFAVQYYTRLP